MPSPANLVTLAQVKSQLRITHTAEDVDLQDKLDEAEDIIQRYLKDQFDETWDADSLPGAVKAAILRQVVHLYRFRGDQEIPELDDHGLAPGVRRLLSLYRDPALA